jgi:4-amino-4-deoxy-L-arabinose transferase-like glycosyltransferase
MSAGSDRITVVQEPASGPVINQAGTRQQAFRHLYTWVLLAALVFYLYSAFRMAAVKAPCVDEGWIVSAPANWAKTGDVGTPALEPTGSWLSAELTGINQYTYWNMPVALVLQGLWYKLLGFSLLTARSLSIVCGALALLSWFAIGSKLACSRLAGAMGAAILATDYTFLWASADARMDMMCAALGSSGLAAYLIFRERHWDVALWAANALIALSVFTHPNGVLSLVPFCFLVLYYDRKRLSARDIAAVTPYLLLAVLWGAYILQRPDLFLAQFSANAAARGGARWGSLLHPMGAIQSELLLRYAWHYGVRPIWGGPVPPYTMAIPLLYWMALGGAWLYRPVRRDKGLFVLLLLATLQLALMTFVIGFKASNYLVFILPLYASVWAIWVWKLHIRKSLFAPASLLLTVLLIGCQIGVERYKIRVDTYRNEYVPTLQFVRGWIARTGGKVVANSYFGIDLGFDKIRDDSRVGFYSGAQPGLVVEDLWYAWFWRIAFEPEEPEVALYIKRLLDTEYQPVFEKGSFKVYERRKE